MARKKAEPKKTAKPNNNAYIEGAGLVADEKITMSLEKNYMPYAMSVLVSRAFPEIDGFKPSHRKLLYTMYKTFKRKAHKVCQYRWCDHEAQSSRRRCYI